MYTPSPKKISPSELFMGYMTPERLLNSFIPPPTKRHTPKTNFWLRPWLHDHLHVAKLCPHDAVTVVPRPRIFSPVEFERDRSAVLMQWVSRHIILHWRIDGAAILLPLNHRRKHRGDASPPEITVRGRQCYSSPRILT